MIRLSPNNYRFVDVGYEVLGGRSFLANVRRIANATLPKRSLTATMDIEAGSGVYTHTPFPETDCEVSAADDLKLVLLHAGVPANLPSQDSTLTIAGQLEAVTRHSTKRRLRKTSHYREKLLTAAMRHKVADMPDKDQLQGASGLEDRRVFFDRIAELPHEGEDRIFGLLLSDEEFVSRAVLAQAELCRQRLEIISSDLASVRYKGEIAMPFIEIPATTPDDQVRAFDFEMRSLLTPPVDMTLGKVCIDPDNVARISY